MSGFSSNPLDGNPPPDGEQYIRNISLIIGSDANPNDAIDLSDFRITFTVSRDSVPFPNSLKLRVYNLSDATAKKIKQEYTRVVLQAGYLTSAFGTIFDGSIVRMMRGANGVDPKGYLGPGDLAIFPRRENPTDTFLEILATDGDLLYNFATIHVTLAAGSTPSSQLQSLKKALNDNGGDLVYYGDPSSFTTGPSPRGQVMHGQVRAYLDKFCATHNATWSIQNNIVEIVPDNSYIKSNMIVISPQTGLIGLPRQTLGGIEFTALLNPYLRVNRAVQIDSGLIQQSQPPYGYGQIDNTQPLSGQGLYRILFYQHIGDTRGLPWYSKIIAIDINQAGVAPGSGFVNYYF